MHQKEVNDMNNISSSRVYFMCGPAGAGKSTLAKNFESAGMTILSFDEESYKRGYKAHPLPIEIWREIKNFLDDKLIILIKQNIDIVLDYSFWSREMRNEYIVLLKKYNIEPKIYYIQTPKEIVLERIRKRNGSHQNDIILTEETAGLYYDNFQPPTLEEGDVIVINGY